MSPEMSDACHFRRPFQFPPYSRVRIWEKANLDWAGKDPVVSFRELRELLPGFQPGEKIAGQSEGLRRAFSLAIIHNLLNDASLEAETGPEPIYVLPSKRKGLTDTQT